jgi:hypothetical protein
MLTSINVVSVPDAKQMASGTYFISAEGLLTISDRNDILNINWIKNPDMQHFLGGFYEKTNNSWFISTWCPYGYWFFPGNGST